MYGLGKTTSYYNAAELEDSQTMGQSFLDFARYGVGASVASGVLGITNTASSFANMFGAEFERVEVDEALTSFGFENMAKYYQQNKDLVDFVGFAATSVVPGVLGLKALKAAQAGLAGADSKLRYVTGLRTALVPKDRVEAFSKKLLTDGSGVSGSYKFTMEAAKQGFHKAAVETAFAETAVLLTMNQHSMLSDGDLTYYDAIKENLGSAAVGLLVGSTVGGTIETLAGRNRMYNTVRNIFGDVRQFADVTLASKEISISNGDKVAQVLDRFNQVKTALSSHSVKDHKYNKVLETELQKTYRYLEVKAGEALKNLVTATPKFSPERADFAFKSLQKLAFEMEQTEVANAFGQLRTVRTYDVDDLMFEAKYESYALYDFDDDSMEKLAKNLAKSANEDWQKISSQRKSAYKQQAIKTAEIANGFAMLGNRTADYSAVIFNNPNRSIQEKIQTMRHEVGHLSGAELAKVLDTEFGRGVRKQLEGLSRIARPSGWSRVDSFKSQESEWRLAHQKAVADGDFQTAESYMNLIRQGERDVAYYSNPDELVADAFAMFNSDNHEKLAKEFNTAFKVLVANAGARSRVRDREALVDLKTGELFKLKDRQPTVADLGAVKQVGQKVIVDGGKGRFEFDVSKPLNVAEDSIETASAKYYAAFKNPFSNVDKDVAFSKYEFDQYNKVLFGLQGEKKFRGLVSVLDGQTKRTFDLREGAQYQKELDRFRKHAMDMKTNFMNEAAISLTKRSPITKANTLTELARLVDVDYKFAELRGMHKANIAGTVGGDPFWSLKYKPDEPTVLKLQYHNKEAADPLQIQTQQEVNKRIEAVSVDAATRVQGFIGSFFPEANINFLPNAAMSKVNRMKGVLEIDESQGLLTSQSGSYGKASEFANSVGSGVTQPMKTSGHKYIDDRTNTAARLLVADNISLAEISVLDVKLRQYKMLETPQNFNDWFVAQIKELPANKGITDQELENFLRATQGIRDKMNAHNQLDGSAKLWSIAVEEEFIKLAANAKMKKGVDTSLLEAMLEKQLAVVESPKVANFMRALNDANQLVVKGTEVAAGLRGKNAVYDSRIWYPGTFDRKRAKEILIVRPKTPGLFGDKQFSFLAAPTQEALQNKLNKLLASDIGNQVVIENVELGKNTHKYILDDYDEELNLDAYFMNSSMFKEGDAWELMPDPTPQIVEHMVSSTKRQWNGIVNQLVKSHYSEEFAALENLDKLRVNSVTSGKLGEADKKATTYTDYISTMLNMPNNLRYQSWRKLQRDADETFSNVWNAVVSAVPFNKTEGNYAVMNQLMDKYGLPKVYNGWVENYLVETEAVNSQILASLVPKMNWFGATTMLRADLIQPIINVFSMPITMVPEIKHLVDALPELRREQVMNSLTVKAVDSTGQVVAQEANSTKLLYQATVNWFKRKDLRDLYKKKGLIGERASIYFDSVDQAALISAELKPNKIQKALEDANSLVSKVGKTITAATDWSEDFTRFIAADMARQVLEAGGIKGHVLDLAQRTYVNRSIGNYHYAQRPALFQGFAGQAVGLFQTYQFNLTQQLLRHLGEQPSRAAAMMALQAGMFGSQSLPGFELLNRHVAERSKFEGDFYTGVQSAVGNEAMEWIMYGIASNMTKPLGDGVDLFSRGNLNPRTATIIPTSFDEIVTVSMATKLWGSTMQFADNIAGGVPFGSALAQYAATNGVNRPLQGIGQIMAGQRTTAQGSFLLDTDDLNFLQQGARILGARGLDEAIAVQNYYRAVAYKTAREDKIEKDAKVVKQHMLSGTFDGAAYGEFMDNYVANGGRLDYYDKWVQNLYKSATESQIYQMYQQHDKPEGRYMQKVMGGDLELKIDTFNEQ